MNENFATKTKLAMWFFWVFWHSLVWKKIYGASKITQKRQNLSTSPLQPQLSFCRAPVTVQMVQLQWLGKDAVTSPAKVPGPSEGNICLKSSLAQSPTLRVLDLVPMRGSSLQEPLKKSKVFSSKGGKDKSKYYVSYSHVSPMCSMLY